MKVNLQRRICFKWVEGQAWPSNAEIVDYHSEKTNEQGVYPPGAILKEELVELGIRPAE